MPGGDKLTGCFFRGTSLNEPNEVEALRAINELRRVMGLPPLDVKTRKCLSCGSEFRSKGPQNRMCLNCCTKQE